MNIEMNMLCRVLSRGMDIIEKEQLGASEHHSMRAAALCAAMGRLMGYGDGKVSALATCALFHDNALTEFHLSEREIALNGPNVIAHCEKGQSNVAWLPFEKDNELSPQQDCGVSSKEDTFDFPPQSGAESNRKFIDGIILYHHERGDGSGPFGKRPGEYPFTAALLAAADAIDVAHHLQHVKKQELPALRDKIAVQAETYSTKDAIDAMLEILDGDMLERLRDENISETLDEAMPPWETPVKESSVFGIARFIAHVIDYKSKFTRKHTSQIANRSFLMAKHYGYSSGERAALFLAASLHDIGKIATPIEVLEKPGKLDRDEFEIIKKHVWYTHEWLREIPNFELIRNWAADHHEKLDGTGYSFGKKADELDFNARLVACLDIYQAVSEPRPYHDSRSHEATMSILYGMADKGFIDSKIVKDLDEVMEEYSLRDVPNPEGLGL